MSVNVARGSDTLIDPAPLHLSLSQTPQKDIFAGTGVFESKTWHVLFMASGLPSKQVRMTIPVSVTQRRLMLNIV